MAVVGASTAVRIDFTVATGLQVVVGSAHVVVGATFVVLVVGAELDPPPTVQLRGTSRSVISCAGHPSKNALKIDDTN